MRWPSELPHAAGAGSLDERGGMRVFHFNFEKGWRGGERQTLLTAAEQRRQGVDSHIACRRGSTLEQMALAAEVPTVPLSPFVPACIGRVGAGDFRL